MYNTYEDNNQGEKLMKKLNRTLGSIITLVSFSIYCTTGSREVFKVVCELLTIINATSMIAIMYASFTACKKAKQENEDTPEIICGDFFVCLLALTINVILAKILIPFIDDKLLLLAIMQLWLFSTITMQITIDTVDRISIV